MVRKPYRRVVRLCWIASSRWPEIVAAYYQINLLKQTPSKFIALVYTWALERVPHDKVDEWLADLDDLLPWEDVNSDAAAEIESASFMAAMAAQKG